MAVKKTRGGDLTITVDAVDYKCHLTNVSLLNEEADNGLTTFCDVANGGARQWYLEGTAVADYQTDSFWSVLWTETGNELPFVFAPYGGASPSATTPHFTGTLKVGAKPPIGGEAGSDWSFDFRLEVVDEPVMDVTA